MTPPELGEIRREFKPGLENLVAGVIIGNLLIGGGSAAIYFPLRAALDRDLNLPWSAEKGWCWFAVLGFAGLGICLVAGGCFLIRWMGSLRSLRVRVGQHGLAVTERHGTRTFLWQEIASVTETHIYERLPILKGPAKYALPKMKSRRFTVMGKDGGAFMFDGTRIRGHSQLAGLIKNETDRLGVPWKIEEDHG